MSTMIRTGILHVPRVDEDAGQSIALILQQSVAGVLILMERSTTSQRNLVEERLRTWCDEDELDLIVSIGGTYPAPGPGSAEIVPEATLAVVERLLPGLAETMRSTAVEETPYALLDRGVSGIRGRTLIVNLPAGETAATLFLESVVDLIEPILLHLQQSADAPTMETDLTVQESDSVSEASQGLNADEFAAYLGRQRREDEHPGDEVG